MKTLISQPLPALLLFVAAVFCFTPVLAQSLLPLEGDMKESWDVIPLTHPILYGALVGDLDEPADPPRVFVRLQSDIGTRLCVSIRSLDHSYWAELQYRIADQPSGVYEIAFPSSYLDRLENYRAGELAILAEVKDEDDCTRGRALGVVPAAWGSLDEPVREITVLANASGAEARLFVKHKDGESVPFSCRDVEVDPTRQGGRSYDTACRFEVDSLLDLSEQVELRRYGTKKYPPVKIPLAIQ